MPTYEEEIINTISTVSYRVNTYILWKYISIYVLFSIASCIIIFSIGKFIPIPVLLTNMLIVIIGLCLIIGIITGILKRRSPSDVAITIDKVFNFKDRFGSALELINKKKKLSAMAELQLEDTAKHINIIDPKSVCPHLIPKTAYILPIGVIVLLALWLSPVFYGEPAEVRQVIQQAGVNIEESARELNKDLSSNAEKLFSNLVDVGKKLQEKDITRKTALRRISNISREVSAMKMITEVSNELKEELSPERKRNLNEILEKLSEILKDMPEMSDLAQKIAKAQQMNLSDEVLKELALALENRRLSPKDIASLQKISDQLQKEKQDITKAIASIYPTHSSDTSNSGENQNVAGATGDSTPSKDVVIDKTQETQSKKVNSDGEMMELNGQLSQKGKSIVTEITTEPEKITSIVPYEELYIKYKSSANSAINTQKIPLTYKNQVKAYFDAISPKGNINDR